MRDAIAASDIFLMPSLAEIFGMMAVEAIACRKPVIIFDGTALYDMTSRTFQMWAVPSRDAEAFHQALQRLINNPAERIQRGKKGREIAELYYSEELHVQNLVKLYKEVISDNI
ncbi:MAG: glycosyltransferase [Rickettsia endosymbiont of Argas persicus]